MPGPVSVFLDAAAASLYRYASVRSRADSPSVAELEANGWTVEHVDPRYGTALMKFVAQPAEQIADEDDAAEPCL
jgi:hypothetical protein